MLSLGMVTVVVREYDEAIAFYVDVMGFRLIEDTPLDNDKRWVVVGPDDTGRTAVLLSKAVNPRQASRIGDQTGGRVGFFMTTDDFERDYEQLTAAGVPFTESPRNEEYGRVVVFEDLYGNRWDLIQPDQDR